jgi:hypothetical protein
VQSVSYQNPFQKSWKYTLFNALVQTKLHILIEINLTKL